MLDLLGALDYCHEHWVSSANSSANILSAMIARHLDVHLGAYLV